MVLSSLTDNVAESLKHKVRSGRFIEMREVFKINKPHKEEISRLAVQKDLDGVPTLVYIPASKKPLTHSEYTFGWRLYKAVYLESHPNEVHAMLQYENDVCNLASQGV